MVLGSCRVFRVVSIEDFLSSAPNMANDISVLIVLMGSPQCFYMVKFISPSSSSYQPSPLHTNTTNRHVAHTLTSWLVSKLNQDRLPRVNRSSQLDTQGIYQPYVKLYKNKLYQARSITVGFGNTYIYVKCGLTVGCSGKALGNMTTDSFLCCEL